MTELEYANEIAKSVGGEVKVVERVNGVDCIGIFKKIGNICPVMYVDEMFKKNVPVEEASEMVNKMFNENHAPDINMNDVCDYEKIKDKIRVQLYNKKTNAEIFKSASEYGFDDLVMIPYIVGLADDEDNVTKARINNVLVDIWNVPVEQVFEDGIANTRKDVVCQPLAGYLFGGPIVLSNKRKLEGAVSALFHNELLSNVFPDGYIIIPSSVHECLACPYDEGLHDVINDMISHVNNDMLADYEVLSDHAYIFK